MGQYTISLTILYGAILLLRERQPKTTDYTIWCDLCCSAETAAPIFHWLYDIVRSIMFSRDSRTLIFAGSTQMHDPAGLEKTAHHNIRTYKYNYMWYWPDVSSATLENLIIPLYRHMSIHTLYQPLTYIDLQRIHKYIFEWYDICHLIWRNPMVWKDLGRWGAAPPAVNPYQ